MTGESCPGCGTSLPAGAAFCPRCGSVLDADLDLRGAPATVPEAERAAPARRGRPSGLLLAGAAVAAVLGGLALSDCSGGDGAEEATVTTVTTTPMTTPTTAEPSAPPTTSGGGPVSAPGSPPTTASPATLPPPAEVAALGLGGNLHILRADGELAVVDLVKGVTRQEHVEGLPRLGPTTLAVLDAGLVLGDHLDGVIAVPADGSPPVDVGDGWVVGSSASSAVLVDEIGRIRVVDAHGRELAIGDVLAERAHVAGVAGGRLVVQAGGHIGLVHPTSGAAETVATGDVLAANEWGLLRVDCPELVGCTLAWGPWGDVDRSTVLSTDLPPDTWGAAMAADGSAVVLRSPPGWWLLGADGTRIGQGSGGAGQDAPLVLGEAVALHDATSVTLEHADGRSLTLLDIAATPQARSPVVAIAHTPTRTSPPPVPE